MSIEKIKPVLSYLGSRFRRPHPLKIVSIFHIYNESRFLPAQLKHQAKQGLQAYIIDNESTDGSLDIVKSFMGRGVIGYETFPRRGKFELRALLQRSEELHKELGADWYLHHDADQFRYAPNPYRTLAAGIRAMDDLGYNAIDFDVFDFLPTEEENDFDAPDFLKRMKYYYYFNRGSTNQVKLWKNFGQEINLKDTGGHNLSFNDRKLAPIQFIQRHYYALGRKHAIEKYCQKQYCEAELADGWHDKRVTIRPEDICFPSQKLLKRVTNDNIWDTSEPWSERYLFKNAPKFDPNLYKETKIKELTNE